MFKGSYRFLQQATGSKKHRKSNVCEGVTATCGPPGHPCETCMHLKGLQPFADAERDLCLIAPRSLVRPIQYKRYFNRGVAVPPYLPVSRVKGELKEVSVPEPCGPEELQDMIRRQQQKGTPFKFKDAGETETPYVISNNVYIEHNGRFTKAPKHPLELGDYSTRVCYLEDFVGPEFHSPLDCAILFQKVWSNLIKVLFGILAGVALIQVTIVLALVPNAEEDDLSAFFNTYPRVCHIFFAAISVLSILTIIAIFDWMDLAHMNFEHMWDTYLHRTIWVIAIPIFMAYLVYLLNADLSDQFFLHGADWTDYQIREARTPRALENLPFRKSLHFWEVRMLGVAVLIIAGWILLIMTRNDDLFLMHLECMKKYDYHPEKLKFLQEKANPRILPP